MIPTYKEIHRKFKINGVQVAMEHLHDIAYSLIKEGVSYEQHIGEFILDWIDENDSLVVTTSGSTGKPKEIHLEKGRMVNSALATGSFFNLEAGNTALLCLPANYIAGKMMIVRAMVLGLDIHFVEPTSFPYIKPNINFDFCAMVPLQVEKSIPHINEIKKLIIGGAAISAELKKKIQPLETKVYETYGMTETITHIAVKEINQLHSKSISIFKTLPGITLQQDNRGCLIISAPNISHEPIITNDVVELESETSFQWLGRYDNVINSGGVKLFPEQLEKKLASFVSNRFFISSQPDEKLGNQLILVVEGKIDSESLLVNLKNDTSFTKFEIPRKILQLDAFIETESGKVDRNKTIAS